MSNNANNANCLRCRHLRITWDPERPRGCDAMGFKTRGLPSGEVFRISGDTCFLFEPKKSDAQTVPLTFNDNGKRSWTV